MVLAESVQSSLVNSLGDIMADNEVKHLGVEEVVDIEHHLGEQPVGLLIERSVNQVRANVGLDGQGQEVLGLGVDIEVGRAESTIASRLKSSLGVGILVSVYKMLGSLLDAWAIQNVGTYDQRRRGCQRPGGPQERHQQSR